MYVYLGLGSNRGDRAANLRAAASLLSLDNPSDLALAPVYESAPLYVTDQPRFWNTVARVTMRDQPLIDVLRAIKGYERQLGRDLSGAAVRYGPRPIDIDILLALRVFPPQATGDSLTSDTLELTVPHPRLAERAFALRPLADLAPDLTPWPGGPTVSALAARVADQDCHLLGALSDLRDIPYEER